MELRQESVALSSRIEPTMTSVHLSPRWQENVIIVTGTIGSGKSTVTALFQRNGAFCASADEFARRVVEPGSEGLSKVVEAFGSEVLTPDGRLDRRALGQIVFTNPEKRSLLESILHPRIGELTRKTFQEALSSRQYDILIYDCPLFFETELHKTKFRSVIVVTASKEVSISRIVKRDGLTAEEAERRLEAQIPIEEKAAQADFVIENSGTLEQLEEAYKAVLLKLKG